MPSSDATTSGDRREPRLRVGLRLLVAIAISAAACELGATSYGTVLRGPVTIVGYPIYADFDANHYLVVFYFISVIFPVLAVVLYQLAARVGPLRRDRPARRDRSNDEVPVLAVAPAAAHRFAPLGGVAVAGGAIALEFAVAVQASGATVILACLLGALALAAIGGVVSLTRGGLAWLEIAGAAGSVAVLCAVSEHTIVTVSPPIHVVHYEFFPLWLGLTVLGLIAVGVGISVRRGLPVDRVARALVTYLTVPIVLFVVIAYVSGPGGRMDTFGEGEYLAGAYLMTHGALPWQNLYLIHGVLDDALKPLLGYVVFGATRWGAQAGINFFWAPAYWVATYLFVVIVYGRRWFAPVAATLAIALGVFANWDPRYLLWPLLLALLAATLRRRSWRFGAALGLFAVAFGLLVPEMFYAAGAAAVTLVAFEIADRTERRPRWNDFPRTLGAAVAAGAAVIGFAIWLGATGGFSGFVGYFSDFASGHSLSGGIPLFTNYAVPGIHAADGVFHYAAAFPAAFTRYWYELVLPVVAVLVTVAICAFRVGSRRRLYLEDWIAICAALLTVIYYPKGLSRADAGHIAEGFDVSVPLLICITYRFIAVVDATAVTLLRSRGRIARAVASVSNPSGLLLIVAIVAVAPTSLSSLLEGAPSHFRNSATTPPPAAVAGAGSLGYQDGALPPGLLTDMAAVIKTYAGPSRTVFDFTNAPALFDYLLAAQPGSRFYDVNLTITEGAQQRAVDDLKVSRPRIVVFGGPSGMAHWDFIQNEVRDHVISRYLLTHYRPLALVDNELVMIGDWITNPPALPPLVHPAVTTKMYDSQRACEFGYIPDFLPSPPTAGDTTVSLTPVTAPRRNEGAVYAFTLPASPQRYDYLEVTRSLTSAPAALAVSDLRNRTQRDINWVIAPGRSSVAVETGACLQWYGFARTIYVRYKGPGELTSASLLP